MGLHGRIAPDRARGVKRAKKRGPGHGVLTRGPLSSDHGPRASRGMTNESETMTEPKNDMRARRDDLAAIEAAREVMKIGEFDLFRRAWRAWFAREADEKRLEAVFVAYLFHREVPVWVRHFCRRVLADDAAVRPAPAPASVPSVAPATPVAARRFAALAVVATVAFLFVAALAGNSSTSCAGATAGGIEDLGRAVADDAGLPPC